ncbi:MAG: phosphopantetheine-binding protein [Nitrososphaerales archaeon]
MLSRYHLNDNKLNKNFFEIGGDSILSIQVISKARSIIIKLTVKDIFQYSPIISLRQVVRVIEDTDLIDQKAVEGRFL